MGFDRYQKAVDAALKAVGRKARPRAQSSFITEREAEEVAWKLFTRLGHELVAESLEAIAAAAQGARVHTPIGTFHTSTRAPRRMKNFQRTWVDLPAMRQLSFTAAKRFRGQRVTK